jgi:hypothetical protein
MSNANVPPSSHLSPEEGFLDSEPGQISQNIEPVLDFTGD